ncbi:MAG: radical SAM protein [Bdellovibrionota bacterium]
MKASWKYRYEPVGGIVALESPPALLLVDKEYLLERGVPPSPKWDEPWAGVLSAPTEVHLALTNYCAAGCPACYMDSRPTDPLEESREDFERAFSRVKALARMGVFHVALGGGETLEVPWLFDLAHEMRRLGMVPNITTSGLALTEEKAEKCSVFGQVNVSVDGIGKSYKASRGYDGFEVADRAIGLLQKKRVRVGINCVLSRKNYDQLDEIFAWVKRTKLQDIELLRFKPAGRGASLYEEFRLTDEQGENLFPLLKNLGKKHRIRVKLDCSFGPFVYFHQPDRKTLEFFSIRGCEGGNWLGAVHPDGRAAPCSFAWDESIPVEEVEKKWRDPSTFPRFKSWWKNPPEPCASCDYVDLCHGGCHAVAKHTDGSFEALDPECPAVRRYRKSRKEISQ